jgi:hypothetical protein
MANAQEPKPKKLYLDQNVFGHMLDEGGGDWRKSPMGAEIEAAATSDWGFVWLSPTHGVETILATDPQRRRQLAQVMLEVAGFARMWHGYDVDIVLDFIGFLRSLSARCICDDKFVHRAEVDAARVWLGNLGLVAAGAPPSALAVDEIRRLKLQNRLLHARFAVDPNNWVDEMIKVTRSWRTTRADVFAPLDAMSTQQIEEEIEALRKNFAKLDKKHFDRLNKERKAIASAYGALDAGGAIKSLFDPPLLMSLTFDTDALVQDWLTLQVKRKLPSLPKDVVQATPTQRRVDLELQAAILETAMQAWSSLPPLTALVSYESVLRELQRRLNDRDLPTPGVVFDADHAACLRHVDVFVTEDGLFGEIVGALARTVEENTVVRHRVAVVTSAAELHALRTGA